ncbi:MAG: HlyD family efflux transporter periplasmic adaptor subunit [Bacteroidota bacterium]
MTPRKIIISAVVGILIVGVGFMAMNNLAGRKKAQQKTTPPTQVPRVAVKTVAYADQETELEYFGRVNAFQSIEIIPEVSGKILPGSVPLKAGQRIRKGQIVARIDDREARLNLQSQKSQFMKAVADILADLKIDYSDRFPTWQAYFESLDVAKALPELPEVTATKEKTFLATRGIFSSYYNILSQEERLKKYKIYAPVSGAYSQVMLEPGSVAGLGSRIATLVRTDQLELVLPVQAGDIAFISAGTAVEVSAQDGAGNWKGSISRIGEKVDAATQSVNVYVKIASSAENRVFDGQYLQARIPGKIVRKAMEIPRKAVVDKDKVFVVQEGKLRLRPIVVHKINPASVIFSGLSEGEKIVLEPPLNAVEDMNVQIIGS